MGSSLYPDSEPYEHGLLSVGDGNAIYWECCGNPNGIPVIYVHGGPGSGSTATARRFFNPETYKIVLFDQRGCGRSRPLLTERSQLESSTTAHLIADIEALRGSLSVDRWIVAGVSWGTTLALAYVQQHPDRVTALVLACVTTTSRSEVDWITQDVGRVFPQQWDRFASHIPDAMKGTRLVDAYATLLFEEDPPVCAAAAKAWCEWEDAHVSLVPGSTPNRRFLDPEYRLRFARIVTHYWRNAAFLEEGQLLENMDRLRGIPGVLVHGAYDVSSPAETAWQLHRRWPESRLQMIADAGHGGGAMPDEVMRALNELGEIERKLRYR